MNKLIIPEFTGKVATANWALFKATYALYGTPNWVPNFGTIQVMTERHAVGIFAASRDPFWYHICHPRLMYKIVDVPPAWFVLGFRYGFFNYSKNTFYQCGSCKYTPTKNELVTLKLAVLGMKL